MECPEPTYDPLKAEAACTQGLRDRTASKGRNTDHALRRFTVGLDVSSDSEFEDDGSHETIGNIFKLAPRCASLLF